MKKISNKEYEKCQQWKAGTMFIKPPFHLLLTILLCLTLFSACRPQLSTPTSREADSVEPSVSQEETVSEPQKSSVSQEDTSTAPAPAEFLPGAFVLQNGNEIQNGPRDKGLNPLLATLIFYEDGSFQFDFDGGLSAGGFSGQYEVEEGRITAESSMRNLSGMRISGISPSSRGAVT